MIEDEDHEGYCPHWAQANEEHALNMTEQSDELVLG
jgi:hypothetical protein